MTDRLDRFETQLTSAIARRSRRSRRRRTACAATAAAVTVTAGAGAASDTLDPLGLFDSNPSLRTDGPMRPSEETRLRLRSADDASRSWSIAAYRANAAICGAIATPASPRPSIGCQGSLQIAEILNRASPQVTASTVLLGDPENGKQEVLVYGFTTDDEAMTVTADGRTVGSLRRSGDTLSTPVDRTDPNLTDEGRKLVESLPDNLRLRLVATDVSVTPEQAQALRVTGSDGSSGTPVAPPSK